MLAIVRTNYSCQKPLFHKGFGKIFLASCFLIIGFVFHFQAQDPIATTIGRNGKRITNTEGLSQGMVYYIYQDSYGFLWISTKDGLNRYDGYDFKIFRNNPDQPESIGSNESLSVLEDHHHDLWINTINKGVDLYMRELDVFLHFKSNGEEPFRLSHDQIYWIALKNEQEVWICTELGIDILQYESIGLESSYQDKRSKIEKAKSAYKFSTKHYPFEAGADLRYLNPQRLHNGKMVGLFDNYPHELSFEEGFKIKPFTVPGIVNTPGTNEMVYTLVSDSLHNRLYLFYKDRVVHWDIQNGNTRIIPNNFPNNSIPHRSGYLDAAGNIWSAFGGIVYCLRFEASTLDQYVLDDLNSPVSAGLAAMSFLVDRSGMWWIGTPGYGLILYNPDIDLFKHSRGTDNSSRSFYALAPGLDSNVLVMGGKYIWQFDLNTRALSTPLKSKGFEKLSAQGNMIGHATLIDSLGNYWVAHGIELYYIDYQKRTNQLVYRSRLTGYNVFTPLLQAKDGSVWYGSTSGLIHFNSPYEPYEEFQIPEQFRTWPDVPFIHSMIESNEYIWLGTVAGIFGFHKRDKQWRTIVHQAGNPHSISPYRVYTLMMDDRFPEKYLWAGLNGGGICRIALDSEHIDKFTTEQGLPNDVVYGLLTDTGGRIWASTNAGITCLLPSYSEQPFLTIIRNFTSADGLQSDEFNRYSYLKLPSGLMVFGGVNGLNSFYPNEVLKRNDPPNIVITDIRIRNQSLTFGNPGDDLPVSPTALETLVLHHDQDMLTIQYAALDYTNSSKNKFKYRLQGLSEEWIDAGFNREANFTNLDPGEYQFTVIGSDSEGVWNETGHSLKIIVLPAWYQTWWFRTSLVLLIVLSVYGFYRYRLHQLRKLQLMRDRIARDLHDEMGSTLSSIALYSELVKEKTEEQMPEMAPVASRIHESSIRLMESMSDIVWAINPDNDDLNNTVQRMRAFAAEITEAAQIELTFESESSYHFIKTDMEKRRNIYLIFREALNNAMKYAGAKKIRVRVIKEQSDLVLEIADDGHGFDLENHKRGNGLISMQKRAEELKASLRVTSQPQQGTTVTLRMRI